MKAIKVMVLGVFIFGIVVSVGKPVNAQTNLKYFAGLDLFLPGNAGDGMKATIQAAIDAGAQGTATITTKAGIGGRIGALYSIENLADVGLSLGYIAGPTIEVSDEVDNMDVNTSFFRVLAEAQKKIKMNDKWDFLGGLGLGMGFGKQEISWTVAGFPQPPTTSYSGITWELTAGLGYKASDKVNVDFGLRYAGFPGVKYKTGEDPSFKVEWSTIGLFTGVSF